MKHPAPATPERQIFSVSELNRRTRQLLETHLGMLWVEGEMSNLARPGSGHWYFTLKDDNAQVRCAMFRNSNRRLTSFKPDNGQQVVVRGRISLYEQRGDYQLIAEHMEPAGLGALQRRFEQLKQKLAAEGLFEAGRKKKLPTFAHHLGIITSPTGAAIRDLLHVLERRFPALPITVYPSAVQGAQATGELVNALERANRDGHCDVLILARGGGSLEDLWSFNEEALARAIAASTIPVVTGVGHETDTTIADFVADLRAPTPSAAAELVSPDANELMAQLRAYENWFLRQAQQKLAHAQHQLESLKKRLRSPADVLNAHGQHLDHLNIRLRRAMALRLDKGRAQIENLDARFQAQAPQQRLLELRAHTAFLHTALMSAVRKRLEHSRSAFGAQLQLLNAVSPLRTLERGYAIAQSTDGTVVSHIEDTAAEAQLKITLQNGALHCTVDTIDAGAPPELALSPTDK